MDYMSLAYGLTHSFLILTPVQIEPGERRIIKYSYEEGVNPPKLRPLGYQQMLARRAEMKRQQQHDDALRAKASAGDGMGLIELLAITEATDDATGERTVERPQPGLVVDLRWTDDHGQPQSQAVTTGPEGRALALVPAGVPVVADQRLPRGLLALDEPVRTIQVPTKTTLPVSFRYRQIGRISDSESPTQAFDNRRLRAGRSLGLRRHKLVLPAPATGHGSTYHVDAEAPEGLQFAGALLSHGRSYWGKDDGPDAQEVIEAREDDKVQRTHLYLPGASQQGSGVLVLRLLPRTSTAARAAFFAAALTSILLAFVCWKHDAIGPNAGSVATLVLLGTGSLSAWVARPREHRMTSVLVQGTRGLALVAGLAGVVGALVVLLDRDWPRQTPTGGLPILTPGRPWSAAPWLMAGASLVAAVCAVLAGMAWHRASRAQKVVQNAH
jgi:hypothetical protein